MPMTRIQKPFIGLQNLEIVHLILEHVHDMNPICDDGKTPLHWAALMGHLEIVKLILENLEHINNKNPVSLDGWTPLECAAQHGHLEIVQLIENTLQRALVFLMSIGGG
jgi:ankyrin repeat protein